MYEVLFTLLYGEVALAVFPEKDSLSAQDCLQQTWFVQPLLDIPATKCHYDVCSGFAMRDATPPECGHFNSEIVQLECSEKPRDLGFPLLFLTPLDDPPY